jgi:pimeloyl-ACP methyl ester carboxylesterase
MAEHRVQRARSQDGTDIAARVEGAGPPLVLLPAGPGDSEMSWGPLLPHLRDHVTCYLLDTRGRGLSANHPDHAPERLVEDVRCFIDTLGEPVRLLEWGTALWAQVAADCRDGIAGVVAYEPGVDEVMSEEIASRIGSAFERVGSLVAEGKLIDASRAFVEAGDAIYLPDELEQAARPFWEAAAPNLPAFLQELEQAHEPGCVSQTDPSVLAKVEVSVCLLQGTASLKAAPRRWFADSVRYVAEHVAKASVRELAGLAHFGPWLEPKPVAAAIRDVLQA